MFFQIKLRISKKIALFPLIGGRENQKVHYKNLKNQDIVMHYSLKHRNVVVCNRIYLKKNTATPLFDVFRDF